jgi:Ca-activated chloride channel family protein
MIAFDSFALLRPWWLIILPLALILYRRLEGGGLADWERAVDPPLLAAMLRRGMAAGGRPPDLSAALWAIVLIALALSGPAAKRLDAGRYCNLDATLLIVDLSNESAQGAQLRQATTAARLILDEAAARQTGLIVYAGDAYLAGALTDDATTTGALIFALDDQTAPDPGVRPDRALSLARRVLREAGIVQGDVVLISTGGGVNDAALREAKVLAAEGRSVHTIFVPGGAHADTPDAARKGSLMRLAGAGQGIADDAAHPNQIREAIAGRAIRRLGASNLTSLDWRDYGRYLLFLAALPLLIAFRRTLR